MLKASVARLRAWAVTLLSVVLALYALCALLIVADGVTDSVFPADLLVVPGNTAKPDGSPSPRLQARLDQALVLYRAGVAGRIFVSGAVGREGVDEAAVMARYLMARGVAREHIIEDPAGHDTRQTARNARRFMQSAGLHSAIVVSQYFHVPRSRLALQQQGVATVGTAHAPYVELRDLYSLLREVPAYGLYWLKGANDDTQGGPVPGR